MRNPWNKRIVPFLLTLCLLLSAWGPAQAAPIAGPVGYVDFIYLVNQHPDTAAGNAVLKAEQEKTKQDFESRAAGLSDTEKQDLVRQLDQRVEQKRQELLRPPRSWRPPMKSPAKKVCPLSSAKTKSSAAAWTSPPMC